MPGIIGSCGGAHPNTRPHYLFHNNPNSIHPKGLDASAGATGRYWGIGSGASPSQLNKFETALEPLSAALAAGGGPFLTGQDLSAADVVLYPFVERFDLALRLFHGYELGGFDGGSITKWLVSLVEVCVLGGG